MKIQVIFRENFTISQLAAHIENAQDALRVSQNKQIIESELNYEGMFNY